MTARRSDNSATALAFAAIVAVSLMASVEPTPSGAQRDRPELLPDTAALRGVPVPPLDRGVAAPAVRPPAVNGYAGWATRSLGPSYLAMRLPRGTSVTICAAQCWTTRTTDYGPSSRIVPSRVADIALDQWTRVCGLPASRGLCYVTVQVVPMAPATDTR